MKKLLPIVVILLMTLPLYAQNPAWNLEVEAS